MHAQICSLLGRCSMRWRRAECLSRVKASGEICRAILHKEPVPPSQLNPQISRGLEAVILRALEKDRNLRYQHASEMRAELQRLKRDSESGRRAAASSGS